MDAERRRHPWRSQSRPEGVVVIRQVKEGGQVRWDIRQAEDYVKENKLAEREHPAGFLTSSIRKIIHLALISLPPSSINPLCSQAFEPNPPSYSPIYLHSGHSECAYSMYSNFSITLVAVGWDVSQILGLIHHKTSHTYIHPDKFTRADHRSGKFHSESNPHIWLATPPSPPPPLFYVVWHRSQF